MSLGPLDRRGWWSLAKGARDLIEVERVAVLLVAEGRLMPGVAVAHEDDPARWRAFRTLRPVPVTPPVERMFTWRRPLTIRNPAQSPLVPRSWLAALGCRVVTVAPIGGDDPPRAVLATDDPTVDESRFASFVNSVSGLLDAVVPEPEPEPESVPYRSMDRAEILTPQALAVLKLVAAGLTTEEIAQQLSVTPHTVKYHIAVATERLGVGTRREGVRAARALGLVPPCVCDEVASSNFALEDGHAGRRKD